MKYKSSEPPWFAYVLVALVVIAIWFPVSWLFMYAWNASIVYMFGAPVIEFWHAFWGLVVLSYFKPWNNSNNSK